MPTARIILGLDIHAEGSISKAEGSVSNAEGSISKAEGSVITDEIVKQAYLQKVRDYPPEQFPEKFRRIREAYELLKDEESRLAYSLFHIDEINTIDTLSTLFLDPLIAEKKRSVPTEKQFLNVLRESLQSKSK
jgi:hypothetical protein